MDIGERLRRLRETKRLSQADLSRLSGLMPDHISRLESGRFVPELATLERLTKALGIRLGELFLKGRAGSAGGIDRQLKLDGRS
jgi:transcriptional regulator with XRE-family HTH domain